MQLGQSLLSDLKHAALRINFRSRFYCVIFPSHERRRTFFSVPPLTAPHHLRADPRLHVCYLLGPMKVFECVSLDAHFLERQSTSNPSMMWHSLRQTFHFLSATTVLLHPYSSVSPSSRVTFISATVHQTPQ